MPDAAVTGEERIRAAELIAALSLATDLGIGVPLEHGLHSTVVAMRLAELLHADRDTAQQTYYLGLLFYVGCTADADVVAEIFGDGESLTRQFAPVMFGGRTEMMAGVMRALSSPDRSAPLRALQAARGLPGALRSHRRHLTALCEVAQMLTDRLGMPASVRGLFPQLTERWDGRGEPGAARGDDIPLSVRIVHVARDAVLQRMVGGDAGAAQVIRSRGGHAFDPTVARCLADATPEILALDPDMSAWEQVLAAEPLPRLELRGEAIDRALAAMGDFADLVSPHLVGHSAGVAALTGSAARVRGLAPVDVAAARRAALVHDLGRVAVPAGIWMKAGPLTLDERERVRLHPYYSERVLCRSPFLASLAPVAAAHHERADGSGYHRGTTAAGLPLAARLLAAADSYHAMTESRSHRGSRPPAEAAEELSTEARAGRLDVDAVAAVLEAAGRPVPRIERPGGLTDREAAVLGLLARGLQTKQIARRLDISPKTADRHIQNAYAKSGVSTRAAAALFAMQHGLTAWGELPMGDPTRRP